MAQPYVGEVRMFAGNFAPSGWAFCNGQLLAISEYDTLFNLIGTTYGGDGQNTFAVPDLQGRSPMHIGSNGQTFQLGEKAGTETVTLTPSQIPNHTHPLLATSNPATSRAPAGNLLGRGAADAYASEYTAEVLSPTALASVGGSQPHENMQPYLCVTFIISLFGIFPSPN
jgi:microcystin-dependent protein